VDIRKSLADAGIKRVAIIDDDLSEVISTKNLQQVNRHLEALLADENDPDHQAYLQVLKSQGYNTIDLTDIAQPLSEKRIRDAAPEWLREAAEGVLTSRRSQAESVRRVIKLLSDSGIEESNIETFYGLEIPDDRRFDLVIVDYYLENDSKDKTIPLIERIIKNHAKQDQPLQLILMSSHEAELEQDFHELRPCIQTSSSRMRILAKPQKDSELAGWKLTLEQLAMDRGFVNFIERFVKQAIDTIKRAADEQSGKLWELDLQAMKVLYATARADNDDFVRYVEECLSRYLLTRLEKALDLRRALEVLRKEFEQRDGAALISASAEVRDSHAALREVMSSMVWRGGGAPIIPNKPTNLTDGSKWIQSFLRFGMVLQDCNERLWLNLTQSCDLAQTKDDELDNLSLLFVAGQITGSAVQSRGSNAFVQMNVPMPGNGPHLITWDLRRSRTLSVSEFAEGAFNNDWTAVGELRLDQAQHVVAKYGAQVTRVGLQNTVRSWKMSGIAVEVDKLKMADDDAIIKGFGFPVDAHMALNDGKHWIYFDLPVYNALQDKFPKEIDDETLCICKGVVLERDKMLSIGPYLIRFEVAPSSIEELRNLVRKKNKHLLERKQNAKKVIIAVWLA